MLATLVETALGAAGDLDSGFGTGGKATTGIGQASTDLANAVAVQGDGKIVAAGASEDSFTFTVVRYNANGTLDTGFGGDGAVTTDFGGGLASVAADVVVQPDGKIVAAGSTFTEQVGGLAGGDFALARYESDGDLDPTFSGDGKLTTDIDGGSSDGANAVAIQSDNKIVVAGDSSAPMGPADFAVARYTSTGALDTPTFDSADADGNGAGKVTTELGTDTFDSASDVVVQADGMIVAAGASGADEIPSDFALARYTTGGALDTAGFGGGDGKVTTDFSGSESDDTGKGLAIQTGDQKLVVAGSSNGDFALARYTTAGALDTSFDSVDSDGKVTTDFSGDNDVAEDVALSGTEIVAAGSTGDAPGAEGGVNDFAVARYETDGDPDDTTTPFDGDGKQTTDIYSGSNDEGRAVAVQTDGKIVVAGAVTSQTPFFGETGDFVLTRYTTGGALDTAAFGGGDGIVDTAIGTGFQDRGLAVAVQADGKIVVAGSTVDETGVDDEDFAVARYNANGTLDTGFSAPDGIATFDFGGADRPDVATSVAIQPGDQKIVVAGLSEESGDNDFAVARLTTIGALDTATFDAGDADGNGPGKVATDFDTTSDDRANGVAIQADGKIVAVGRANPSGSNEFAVARYTTGGALDTVGFGGGDGTVTTGVDSEASTVAIQPADQKIVVAGLGPGGFMVVRYTTAGVPDATFGGGDGIATTDFGVSNQGASDVAIQPNGAIVAAGFSQVPDAPIPRCFTGSVDVDFALARFTSAGGPDNSFSGDSKLTTDFGPGGDDEADGIGVQSDGSIVAAGLTGADFGLARYTSGGALDSGFGAGGLVTTDIDAASCDEGSDVEVTSAGVVVAGTSDGRLALARYQTTTPPPPPPLPLPAIPAAASNAFTLGGLKGTNLTLNVGAAGNVNVRDASAAAASGKAIAAKAKRRLKPSSARAAGPGQVVVTLRLTKLAKKILRQKGKVRVRPAITFTPDGGSPNTQTASLKIRKVRR